jgi:hypothetical protein
MEHRAAHQSFRLAASSFEGCGLYRYGYQRNWTVTELQAELELEFDVQRKFVMHADADMKIIARSDRAISHFVPAWGRYICFIASKNGRPK